jgi:hypothetical protein
MFLDSLFKAIYVIRCNNSNSGKATATCPASNITLQSNSHSLTAAGGIMGIFLQDRVRLKDKTKKKSNNSNVKSKRGSNSPSATKSTPSQESSNPCMTSSVVKNRKTLLQVNIVNPGLCRGGKVSSKRKKIRRNRKIKQKLKTTALDCIKTIPKCLRVLNWQKISLKRMKAQGSENRKD